MRTVLQPWARSSASLRVSYSCPAPQSPTRSRTGRSSLKGRTVTETGTVILPSGVSSSNASRYVPGLAVSATRKVIQNCLETPLPTFVALTRSRYWGLYMNSDGP